MRRPYLVGLLSAIGLLAAARPSAADPNDLVLSRLVTLQTNAMGQVTGAKGDQAAFRSLVSQLGIVLAPPLMSPAATLGWSGFELTTQLGVTTLSPSGTSCPSTSSCSGGTPYWRALEQANPMTGAGAPSNMSTLTVMMRKGLWLPVPSFEVGAGMTHLLDSSMYAMVLDGKVALNEGFTRWPLPSLAVRGEVSRLTGSTQLDLTVAGVDVSISKLFGIGGTWSLTPFAGWNYLYIIPRSQVIDTTPNVDAYAQTQMGNISDLNANYVFPNQDAITRQRLFLGVKAQYYKLAFLAQAEYILAGHSTSGGDVNAIPDSAESQQSYVFSVALDF